MLKTTLSKDGVKEDGIVKPKAIKDMTEHQAKTYLLKDNRFFCEARSLMIYMNSVDSGMMFKGM